MIHKHFFSFIKKQSVLLQSTKMSSATNENTVLFEKVNNVGIVTFNRPKQLNAISHEMINRMNNQVKIWENDPEVSLIVTKNRNQGNAFSSGGDIKAVVKNIMSGNLKSALEQYKNSYSLFYQMSNSKKPNMSIINGLAMGGGTSIALNAKYCVATERTIFGITETSVGFYPDIGFTHRLSRLKGKLGLYLSITGARLQGKEMYDAGLATHYINSSNMESLVNDLKSADRPDNRQIDQLLSKYNTESRSKYSQDKIDALFNADSVENIIENLESDKSEWAKKHLEMIRRLCPLSVKVAFEQFKYAPTSTLQHVLQTDFCLTHRFFQDNNITEGIRAMLIERDYKPKWNPAKIEDVSRENVLQMFKSHESDEKIQFEIVQSRL